MKKFMFLLLCLYSIRLLGADEVGNGGDRLQLLAEEARFALIETLSKMQGNEGDHPRLSRSEIWLAENLEALLKDVRGTRYIWQDALPGNCKLNTCACTGTASESPVYFSFNRCMESNHLKSDFVKLIAHETVHHFQQQDEAFADEVALAIYRKSGEKIWRDDVASRLEGSPRSFRVQQKVQYSVEVAYGRSGMFKAEGVNSLGLGFEVLPITWLGIEASYARFDGHILWKGYEIDGTERNGYVDWGPVKETETKSHVKGNIFGLRSKFYPNWIDWCYFATGWKYYSGEFENFFSEYLDDNKLRFHQFVVAAGIEFLRRQDFAANLELEFQSAYKPEEKIKKVTNEMTSSMHTGVKYHF